jgi:hypothetical protein
MRWLSGAFLFLLTVDVYAVAPRYWVSRTADEFLAGESEGMAITSRGELRPAPAVRKLGSFTDPFVLSQTADSGGRRYFGTGNGGRVYRLSGNDLKLLYTAPEPEVYAVTFHAGALLVATSPNGKIYRVDPESGKASDFFDPKQAYIWALLPVGDQLYVATGVEGKLFRVDRNGSGKEVFDAPESHIRSLASMGGGRVLAGGSGEGRIYEIGVDGKGRAIFDSNLTEISALEWDEKSNSGWAAGVSNMLPSTAPAKTEPAKSPAGGTGTTASANQEKSSDEGEGSVSVDVSFSFDDQASTASTSTAGAELYRIASDGFVETVRRFDREVVYALENSGDGGLYISTGPLGRVYQLRNGEIALVASVPEKQIVSFERSGNEFVATTSNSGAVYGLTPSRTARSEFRSAVKDTERFSEFGHFEVEGTGLDNSGASVSFRSGNTNTPDETWSDWSTVKGLSGEIAAPRARFVQWRVVLDSPRPDAAINAVTAAYVNRNVAPVIDALTVLEPGAIFISSNYPASPNVVEATNPDEYGIFTGLDAARTPVDPGKRMFRKGYRTVVWKGRDENGDTIRYDVNFRPRGSDKWLRLRHRLEESQMNFDASQLPDGEYELQLVASDEADNAGKGLTDQKEGVFFNVDNASPSIAAQQNGDSLVVRVSDTASVVGRVEYSVDAQNWTRLVPEDGIADSKNETFRIPRTEGSLVMVRAVDGQYNVVTTRIP